MLVLCSPLFGKSIKWKFIFSLYLRYYCYLRDNYFHVKDCVSIKLYCFKYCTDIVSLIVYALYCRACISRK